MLRHREWVCRQVWRGFTGRSPINFSHQETSLAYSWYRGALVGETKRRVFQIPCKMQRGLDLLRSDYTKERNKRECDHDFGVWR